MRPQFLPQAHKSRSDKGGLQGPGKPVGNQHWQYIACQGHRRAGPAQDPPVPEISLQNNKNNFRKKETRQKPQGLGDRKTIIVVYPEYADQGHPHASVSVQEIPKEQVKPRKQKIRNKKAAGLFSDDFVQGIPIVFVEPAGNKKPGRHMEHVNVVMEGGSQINVPHDHEKDQYPSQEINISISLFSHCCGNGLSLQTHL